VKPIAGPPRESGTHACAQGHRACVGGGGQVVFHLQTREPPILPPICELFGLTATEHKDRPLHNRQPPNFELLKVPGPFGWQASCPAL
jgi:hypothetical protein